MGGEVSFCFKFGLHFLFQDLTQFAGQVRTVRNLASSFGSNCRCTSTSGDYIRWESSSEGSNRRCKSLAAKALIAAANSIKTLITISIRFTL